jgi:hypothetical protein
VSDFFSDFFLVEAFLVVLDAAVVDFLVAFLLAPEVPVVSVEAEVELEVETDSLFAAQEVKNPMAARTVM